MKAACRGKVFFWGESVKVARYTDNSCAFIWWQAINLWSRIIIAYYLEMLKSVIVSFYKCCEKRFTKHMLSKSSLYFVLWGRDDLYNLYKYNFLNMTPPQLGHLNNVSRTMLQIVLQNIRAILNIVTQFRHWVKLVEHCVKDWTLFAKHCWTVGVTETMGQICIYMYYKSDSTKHKTILSRTTQVLVSRYFMIKYYINCFSIVCIANLPYI